MTTRLGCGDWLLLPRPNPLAELRLLCFPHAGSGPAGYRWLERLPPWLEVALVQLPGREARLLETPYRRLPDLVPDLAGALAPALDLPEGRRFAFFGHSMGSLLAFELARLLRRQGLPGPVGLAVSGRSAPHLPPAPERVPMHDLPEDRFLERLRRYNGTPGALLGNPELLRMFLPTLRADFAAVETYRYDPSPPLDAPLAAYGGTSDPDVSAESVAAWSQQTRADFRQRMFPGDHFFLLHDPAPVLTALADDLATARSG